MNGAPERLPIVGVMGSGSSPHIGRVTQLGSWVAAQGFHLLTGGGAGVMTGVSRAFRSIPDRRGLVIGIIPCVEGDPGRPLPGYPNPWVDVPILTHLPLRGPRGTEPRSRNHINVLSSDVVVALPGGSGTRSEVELALAYARPLIAWLGARDEIPSLPAEVPVTGEFSEIQEFVLSHVPNP